jgi:hypothetical protein
MLTIDPIVHTTDRGQVYVQVSDGTTRRAMLYGDTVEEATRAARQFIAAADTIDVCKSIGLWIGSDGDRAEQLIYIIEKADRVVLSVKEDR